MAEVIYAGDGGAFKSCTKCQEIKPLQDFGILITVNSGRRSACKKCEAARALEHHHKNRDDILSRYAIRRAAEPERFNAYARKSHARHREERNFAAKQWKSQNTDYVTAYNKKYYQENRDELLGRYAEWANANRDYRREYMRGWYAKNPDKYSEYHLTRAQSVKYRIENALRCRIWSEIVGGSKGGRRTIDLLDFTVSDLRKHLERQFTPGMSWDNYGDWQIDHIIPLASFEYETPEDPSFKFAWSLTNLQPLWAEENKSKLAKRLTLL